MKSKIIFILLISLSQNSFSNVSGEVCPFDFGKLNPKCNCGRKHVKSMIHLNLGKNWYKKVKGLPKPPTSIPKFKNLAPKLSVKN